MSATAAYLTLPPTGYYIPSTLGNLTGQSLAQCKTACSGIPNCVGVTVSDAGDCEFMQVSDLGHLGRPVNSGSNKETSYLNCSNLCGNATYASGEPRKVLGISVFVWLTLLCVALDLAIAYASTLSSALASAARDTSLPALSSSGSGGLGIGGSA